MNTEAYGDALDSALREIARLHALNEQLVQALERIESRIENGASFGVGQDVYAIVQAALIVVAASKGAA